ncbi:MULTISPECIES: type IVB secretion system protein IcmH/DotU [unclassified Duganella]|uniref:type IVB secretion system protein IcmH/DotU n=1 Tax=unclassified Duganella TaxID=2636909 RepID=UPI0006F79A63|nr:MULTISPECIES: type IVB secretion system protein IcmH/DotU [unclassified Duganella]KQV45839.1 type VI secretion system protein ImpK [Duganella sp. Root336D2]KRC03715.1 type VI secretion system protein ImpK [Duganella sp. Root198D2]
MNHFIERRAAPPQQRVPALVDLMHEGFHMLSLLRHGGAPPGEAQFAGAIRSFLEDLGSQARDLHIAADDIESAKYAFCAALDETILASTFPLRDAWERRPLQLLLFGDQLAGEHFFDKLEQLRLKGSARLQALQVFHMCLLLGFKGRYALDDADRLSCLTARLGEEIAHLRGKDHGFAPRSARPDNISHKLQSNAPLWISGGVFALTALASFGAMRYSLASSTSATLAAYQDVVKQPPRPATLTMTLP